MILPFGLQKDVDSLLKSHLSLKLKSRGDSSLSRSSSDLSTVTDEGLYERQEPLAQNSVVMEKILRRKSLQLRSQQQDWKVCLFPLSFCYSYCILFCYYIYRMKEKYFIEALLPCVPTSFKVYLQ